MSSITVLPITTNNAGTLTALSLPVLPTDIIVISRDGTNLLRTTAASLNSLFSQIAVDYQAFITGGSYTGLATVRRTVNKNVSTATTFTYTMPATAGLVSNQEHSLTTEGIITTLTISGNSGQTVVNAPTTLAAGSSLTFVWDAADLTWQKL